MTERFKDKVALVTGGSSGIGRSAAIAFAKEGASVVVSSNRNITGGIQTVKMIEEQGGKAKFVQADIGSSDDIQKLVNETIATFNRLDIAFNNAGTQGPPAVYTADSSEEDWDDVINVNVTGTFLCMKYQLQQMLKQGSGVIVNTSSISGLNGTRGCSSYVASKHAMVGLTKAAALDYAHLGIRINAICPGFTRTPLLEGFVDLSTTEGEQRIADRVPLRRIATPDNIADVVLWLCSDSASYVTAHALTVDGGFTSQL